ncbi:MAG: hypothetical protein M3Q69_03960 [Acidobacteriota bacterium]|nr:hypothetical protein [Acidobacteriota bacterium]
MNLTFFLEELGAGGIARDVLAYADVLVERGHAVRIVTTGEPVHWRTSRAEWRFVDSFAEYDRAADEIVVTDIPKLILVEDHVYRPVTPRESEPLRVLIAGAAHEEAAGIDDAYGAVAHARWFHQQLDLIRASPWAPSREEPLENVQEFHVGLTSAEFTRLLHSCDLVIAAGHVTHENAFPAADAMAAGIPCLLTTVTLYLSFDMRADYAAFGPEQNPVELGERLIELLGDEDERERLRTRGREVAAQWRANVVAARLEAFFAERSAADGRPPRNV